MLGVVKSVEVVTLDVTSGLNSLTTNLTKGQDVNNCVPFLTQQIVTYTYFPDRWMMDVYFSDSPPRVTVERTTTGERMICVVTVVEFDPNKVRVQQKSFNMPIAGGGGTQTVDVAFDYEITSGRTAMVHHYRQSTGTDSQADKWAVRRGFSGTTLARFVRRDSDTTAMAGNFYVFESLDSAFTVQNIFMDMNTDVTSADQIISEVNINKSWILPHSFYSTRNHATADDNFVLVKFKNSTAVECSRRTGSASYIQVGTQVVTHHDDTHVDHGQFDFADGQQDKQIALPDAVDLDYSAPISTARNGMLKPVEAMSTDYTRSFARVWYLGDSTIRAYRQSSSNIGQLRYQSVEFAPAPGYYFGGYVTELGSPAVRTVRCYHRNTGELLGETTSSGVGGYYYLETTYSGEQYIVALDADADPTFNLLGYDLMVPTTISGG